MLTRFEEIRNKAALVRNIELVAVLERTGAVADTNDPSKWHTPQGVLSVTGRKFFNWTRAAGGGGAIDLIMHLENYDFTQAVSWLTENFSCPAVQTSTKAKPPGSKPLILPKKDNEGFAQMTRYLTSDRCLPSGLIRALINAGNLYADDRANAVFLLLGKGKTVVGAEIRGTTNRTWHALAPGSRKDLGCFYVKNDKCRKIVICESAIDAISYLALDPHCMALSTAGAHPNPTWLLNIIKNGFEVFCGFDADETGEAAAEKMIALYPTVKRLRPTNHDWNLVLKSTTPHKTSSTPLLSSLSITP